MNEILVSALATVGAFSGIIAAVIANKAKKSEAKDAKELELNQFNVKVLRETIENLQLEHSKLRLKYEALERRFDALKAGMIGVSFFGDESPIAMWVKDTTGRRIYHNLAYESVTGQLFTLCAGKTDFEICENQSIANEWAINDNEVMRAGTSLMAIEHVAHRKRPENKIKCLSVKWPAKVNGKTVGVEGIAITLKEIQKVIREYNE